MRYLIPLLLVGCAKATPAVETPTPAEPDTVGPVNPDWVAARVADAQARLSATPGGQLVWEAIDAHGGLAAWYSQGTIRFTYDYSPIDAPDKRKYTVNEVDLWSSRVRQTELGPDADAVFGFDGKQAWIAPGPTAFNAPADFWSLTPYYFVSIPFVFADPGVLFEVLEPVQVGFTTYDLVKATYDPALVAEPGDYYVLYIHPVSKHVEAIRYVVTYGPRFPDGGRSPEKFQSYETLKQVGDFVIATHVHTHVYDEATGEIGPITTDVRTSGIRFGETWPVSIFEAPPLAVKVP